MYISRPEQYLGVHNIDKYRYKIRDEKQIQTFIFIKCNTVNKVIFEGNTSFMKEMSTALNTK
jgi:hypothetical protein